MCQPFAVDHRHHFLAHEVIDEKSNEIPAAQALIAAMGLSDRVFTLERQAYTAEKTFEIARGTGNELIVQVKANQPGLLQRCEHIAATAAPIAVDESRNLARIARKTGVSKSMLPAPPSMTTNGRR